MPNENGRFTKFTNTRGLSAVGLNYDGYLFSGSGNIGDSGISGRVALVSDDAYIE